MHRDPWAGKEEEEEEEEEEAEVARKAIEAGCRVCTRKAAGRVEVRGDKEPESDTSRLIDRIDWRGLDDNDG